MKAKAFMSSNKGRMLSLEVRRMWKFLLPVLLAVLLFTCQQEPIPGDSAVYIIGPIDMPEDPDWGLPVTLDSPVFISPDAIAYLSIYSYGTEFQGDGVYVCSCSKDGGGFNFLTDGFSRDGYIDHLGYQRLSSTADGKNLLLSLILNHQGWLFLISTEDGEANQLDVPYGQFINADACISPDGEWIAYTDIDGLWKMQSDGRRPQLLVPVNSEIGQLAHYPSWSPDCKTICFCLEEYNQGEDRIYDWICLISADGGEVEKLVCGGTEPAFSPDGESIAFVSQREFWGDKAIYVVPVGGGAPREITYPPDYEYQYPNNPVLGDSVPIFSPDGKTILFRSDIRTEPVYCDGASVWKINIE
jgi:hypothetical protein